MAETCPHCGEQLPIVRDAFCSSCLRPLDESPVPEKKTVPSELAPRGIRWWVGTFLFLTGAFVLITGVIDAGLNSSADNLVYRAGYLTGRLAPGLFLTFLSVWLCRRTK